MHRKGIVFIFIYKLNNLECSGNLNIPSPELGNILKLCGPVRDKVRSQTSVWSLDTVRQVSKHAGGISTEDFSHTYTTTTAHKYFPAPPTD